MKQEPKICLAKTGENILLREATKEDAEQLIAFLLKNLHTTQFIPLYPDELTNSLEEKIDWIQSFSSSENNILIVAEHHKRIIGNISLTAHSRQMLKHTGLIGMGVLEDWRNKGIGTILLETLISWAEKNEMLEILWLQVFGENSAAIALYKKTGFLETGRQSAFFKTRVGKYFDNVIMTKYLKKTNQ